MTPPPHRGLACPCVAESLCFFPAGTLCDHRAVLSWALVEQGSGPTGPSSLTQALTFPLPGPWGSHRPLLLPKTQALHAPPRAQHGRLGGGFRTCIHPDLQTVRPKGVYRDPVGGGRGCEQQGPLWPGLWTGPLPLGLSSCLTFQLPLSRGFSGQLLPGCDPGNCKHMGPDARVTMASLADDETQTRHGPPQSAFDSHVSQIHTQVLKALTSKLPRGWCRLPQKPVRAPLLYTLGSQPTPPFQLWTPWPQTSMSAWSPKPLKVSLLRVIVLHGGYRETQPTGYLQARLKGSMIR